MAKAKTQAQQAADAANAALAPEEQGIADLQSQAAAQQQAELASVLGFTNASAQMAQQYAPAVQSAYTHAAATQGALAKGFSDGFRQAQGQQAGNINSFLSQQGAPSGQMLPGDTGAADAMFGIDGYIPASTFAREGAAFGSAAARYPQTVMGIGQAYQAQVNQRYAELQQKYAGDLMKIKSQYPELYTRTLGQLQQNALAWAELDFKKKLARDQFGLDYIKATQTESPQVNASASRALGYLVDDYGNPITDANGNLRPVSGYNKGNKGGKPVGPGPWQQVQSKLTSVGFTRSLAKIKADARALGLQPGDYLDAMSNAVEGARTLYNTKRTAPDDTGKQIPLTNKQGVQVGWGYRQALQEMVKQGVPRRLAVQALNAYYKPGERGRPGAKFKGGNRPTRADDRLNQPRYP